MGVGLAPTWCPQSLLCGPNSDGRTCSCSLMSGPCRPGGVSSQCVDCPPPGRFTLLSGHVTHSQEVWLRALRFVGSPTLRLVLSAPRRSKQLLISVWGGLALQAIWKEVRHVKVGGLTAARFHLAWYGYEGIVFPPASVPARPQNYFLNPAADLPSRRAVKRFLKDGGVPWEANSPYQWPLPMDPWVKMESVFVPELVTRPLTLKERAQLLDLRPDWAAETLPLLWEINSGTPLPLRFPLEFAVASLESIVADHKVELPQNDWRTVRPPRLEDFTPGSEVAPNSNIRRLAYFGWVWEPADSLTISKAIASDDAKVNYKLWDIGGPTARFGRARDSLRAWCLRWWVRHITCEATQWLLTLSKLPADEYEANREGVRDCVLRCIKSSWWKWEGGSRLMFWQWPPLWRKEARDGARTYLLQKPEPRMRFPPMRYQSAQHEKQDAEKLLKLIVKGYIEDGTGRVRSVIPRFIIPKGLLDIRVVWNLTQNLVNLCCYAPSFQLRNIWSIAMRIMANWHSGDFDVEEQFHNYILESIMREYCGIILSRGVRGFLEANLPKGTHIPKHYRWGRLPFGWRPAPYFALRMFARGIEIAKGDPHHLPTKPNEKRNPYSWSRVVLNLPGSKDYNPSLLRVMKIQSGEGKDTRYAAECITYFDDGWVFADSDEKSKLAIRKVCSGLGRLGNQDATRKRRAEGKRPGAWSGACIYTDHGLPRAFIPQEKWDRLKKDVTWILTLSREGKEMPRTEFRRRRGFLVHGCSIYDWMPPTSSTFISPMTVGGRTETRTDGGLVVPWDRAMMCS
mmetsp:Transcript_14468/g.20830  ORF Transcript_14468/g.20830 Transcript_14468/m.20830 type:complete len:795 (+) Transcript_14468:3270-5654(+)